jgi:hypothetical protein
VFDIAERVTDWKKIAIYGEEARGGIIKRLEIAMGRVDGACQSHHVEKLLI